jgi:1-acyl-sn-glycerol-3-phosphate acyltransferase
MDSRFSPHALWLFEAFFRPWMRRRLHSVHVAGLPERLPEGLPLVLVANHVSWWDAFLLREVQRVLRPRGPVRTLMLEPELRRFPFFRWMGVVGAAPGNPASVARAMRALAEGARERPDSTILYFPQGRIWPSHRRPLGFARGVEGLLRRLTPVTVLPVAIHLEPLTAAAPTAFLSIGSPILCNGHVPGASLLERRVTAELDALLTFLALHGEAAPAVWPGPHGALPHRRAVAEAAAGAP